MGNKAVVVPFVFAIALLGATFLFNPAPADAASRDSLAQGILGMLKDRLCDRQEKLGGRVTLIHPSKCSPTPPAKPTVTLTADPTTIDAGESSTLTWSSTNATSCTASGGWSGTKATSGSTSVSPTETVTYTLTCTGPGGTASDDATVTVIDVEPEDPTVEITADPMTIIAGSSSTLTWNSENADSCEASNGWSGSKALDGSQSVSPTVTTTYTITCEGDGGSASDSVTVTVNQPEPEDPTLDLTANPTTINEGSSSLLSWSTTNASSCEKSGGWSGATTTSGTLSVSPTATTTYSMECVGAGGTTTDSVTVNVILAPDEPDAPTVNLVASPETVIENSAGSATTTLTWTTTDATSCMASGGTFTGSKNVNDSEVVTPTATTTYSLECIGAGGTTTDSVIVNFVPEDEPEPEVGTLLISEVLYNPSVAQGVENGNEWIEIFNGTDGELNLSGYFVEDNSETFILPQGTTLASGAFLLLTGSSTTAGLWTTPSNASWLVLSGFSSQLANTNDSIELFNTASSSVDAVCWGINDTAFDCDTLVVDDGESLGRVDNFVDTGTASDWQNQTPNPGE